MLGEALDLHKSVCPETMRPMHERMERELFAEFSLKYGAPVTAANKLVCPARWLKLLPSTTPLVITNVPVSIVVIESISC